MLVNSHDPCGRDQKHSGPALMGLPLSCFSSSCLELVTLHGRAAGPGQAFLVASADWGADVASAAQASYGGIAQVLQNKRLTIVHERLFGSLTVKPAILAARKAGLSVAGISPSSPLTYIQGHPPGGEGFAGVTIRAVAGDAVWTIQDQGQPMGRGWRQGDATFLLLQNLQGLIASDNGANSRPLRARRMIERAAAILESQGHLIMT